MILEAFESDPKRLAFTFARYKFAAKMLEGLDSVLEVGSGDCFASRIVKQHVNRLVCTDIDEKELLSGEISPNWPIVRLVHDITYGPLQDFDGVFSLDVMEHIKDEDKYLSNIRDSLKPGGVFVVGMPSLESQAYASELSRKYHVNCLTQADLKASLKRYFPRVFMFGMNDETLHTGFGAMSHYLLGLCLL